MNTTAHPTILKAIDSSWIILKLVVPISILSDILQYYDLINYIAFIFTPITDSLNLPAGVALSLASGMFLNIYAGIAVASSLNLTGYEWTIVGVFISICHSLPLEIAILKKVGVGVNVHWISRFVLAYVGAYIASIITDVDLAGMGELISINTDMPLLEYTIQSVINALVLAAKVVVLVVGLMLILDYIKNIPKVEKYLEKHNYIAGLSIGGLLGITYGAAILLQEIKQISRRSRILILSFLLIAHALIEETLIYALFNADVVNILIIRVGLGLVAVGCMLIWLKYFDKHNSAIAN